MKVFFGLQEGFLLFWNLIYNYKIRDGLFLQMRRFFSLLKLNTDKK